MRAATSAARREAPGALSFSDQLAGRAARRVAPVPLLLADRLEAWARALPPGRLARGVVMAEVAHAMRVRPAVARAVLLDAGWRYRPADDEVHPGWWLPPPSEG